LRYTANVLMRTRFNCRDRRLSGSGVASDADQLGKIKDRRERNSWLRRWKKAVAYGTGNPLCPSL